MSSERSVELCLKTPDETAQAAGLLAPLLRAGDCVLLDGNLGTGKTHFARALIQKRLEDAGLWEEVPSPTYTLWVSVEVEIHHLIKYVSHGFV